MVKTTCRKLLRLLFVSVLLCLGCGSEEGVSEEGDAGTDPGADAGDSGGAGTDPETGLCPDFAARLVECGASDDVLPEVEEICAKFDASFVESFNEGLYGCLVGLSCEELIDLMDSPDAGVPDTGMTDAGIPGLSDDSSVIETCMFTALISAEPGPANEAFQQHSCDWLVPCDPDMGPNQCNASFVNSQLMFFTVMAEPFALKADACVNPPPPCENTQAVELCLNAVVAEFGQAFDI